VHRAVDDGDAILAADVELARLAAARYQPLDLAARDIDARQVLIAIVLEHEIDRAPVA
jgi:hypothetical protein